MSAGRLIHGQPLGPLVPCCVVLAVIRCPSLGITRWRSSSDAEIARLAATRHDLYIACPLCARSATP